MADTKNFAICKQSNVYLSVMNFLSHYYFDRNANSYQVLGAVLPDLLKHASNARIHPGRIQDQLRGTNALESILQGWNNHLEVDRIFHNSGFFSYHTGILKAKIKPLVEHMQFRPSFMAHITLELLLDYLLLQNNKVHPGKFYEHLEDTNTSQLTTFLTICGFDHQESFFKFYSSFKSSRYLFSYQQIENISYAINRICMRVWPDSLNVQQQAELTLLISAYANELKSNYLKIYAEIDLML